MTPQSHSYPGIHPEVLRFMADTRDDLADAARTLDRLINREFAVIDMNGRDYVASDLQ